MEDSEERLERQKSLNEAVRETQEPPSATEARASDDAATRARQAADSSKLRRAADALDQTRARLRQTSAELRERERELGRTGDLVRDVERKTEALRSTTPTTKSPEQKK